MKFFLIVVVSLMGPLASAGVVSVDCSDAKQILKYSARPPADSQGALSWTLTYKGKPNSGKTNQDSTAIEVRWWDYGGQSYTEGRLTYLDGAATIKFKSGPKDGVPVICEMVRDD